VSAVAVAPRSPGRPSRTESQRNFQRQRLIEEAMAAVRHHGPNASVDVIAAYAGVSKPVIYAEFGDKAGIAEAIALARAEQVERSLIAGLANRQTLDAGTAVRAAVESLINLIVDEPEIYGFIVRSVRKSDHGLLENALVRTLHSRVGILTSLVAPDANQAQLAVVVDGLFGFVFAAVESWHATQEIPQQELVETIVKLVEYGFAAIGGPVISFDA
jgi:AcrR family transcriptional regulator